MSVPLVYSVAAWQNCHLISYCCYYDCHCYYLSVIIMKLGYWHLRDDERHGNPPRGNQELLVVKTKLEHPQVSYGVYYGAF